MIEELISQGKKALVAVVGTAASALTLNQWVMLLTGCYVVLQFAYLSWKWRVEWSDRRSLTRR